MSEPLRLIDLFCGAGGFTQGFVSAGGFTPVFAVDSDEAAMNTYRANFDPTGAHSFLGRIEQILAAPETVVPPADVVIGGPPCQGFSLLNKERRGDPRRELWRPFLEVARRAHARCFVMENVPQLLQAHEYYDLLEAAADAGFAWVSAAKLCAADFGAPQVRYRAIVIGSRCGPLDFPLKTHRNPAQRSARPGRARTPERIAELRAVAEPAAWRDVRWAIGDLTAVPVTGTELRPELGPPWDLHFGRRPTAQSLERYRTVPPGGNRFDLQRRRPDLTPACWIRKTSGGTDLFGRLWWDRPAVTIRTEFYKPEKGRYLHPELDRPITHREAARLQGFPDAFRFRGTKTSIARQIGNAVPPHLAHALAAAVRAQLTGAV